MFCQNNEKNEPNIALVTGASKGIGHALVKELIASGCKLFGFSDDIAGHSLRAGHVTSSIKMDHQKTYQKEKKIKTK